MRKCLLAVLLFFILITPGYAQRFKWANNLNVSSGNVTGMDVDASGNSYVTGSFDQTVTFGSTTITGNGTDIFVLKYDSAGTVQWARQAGGASYDAGYGIAVDQSGNSYVIGHFNNNATFGSISIQAVGPDTSSFMTNMFIAKYNPEGVVQWVKKISNRFNNFNQIKGVDTDPLGNVYVTGYMNGTTVFGSISLTGSSGMFVAKYSPNGDIQWARRAGATSFVSSNALSVDGAGNSYVTGTFTGTATFETTSITTARDHFAGDQDVFVAKYSTVGNLVWVQRAGGSGYDEAKDIGVDQAGNCVMMGRFAGTAGFSGITMTSVNANAIFIAKYSANGQVQWAKQMDVNQYYTSYGYGLSVDPIGSCYLTGFFGFGIARFDNISLQSYGKQDTFIAKCDANGTFQCSTGEIQRHFRN